MNTPRPAIARIIEKHRGDWGSGGTPIGKIMEVIAEYRDEIEAVAEAPGIASFFSAPVMAGAVLKIKESGRAEQVIAFLIRVMRGEMLQKNQPEYHLRNLVMGGQSGGATVQREFLLKSLKAIEYHLRGNPMGILRAD